MLKQLGDETTLPSDTVTHAATLSHDIVARAAQEIGQSTTEGDDEA